MINLSGLKKIKVEVGSGESPTKGYIHCDIRDLPQVDYVCNAWDLPFKENTLDEIHTRYLLEHLTRDEGGRAIKEWYSKLKNGGYVDIVVPDLNATAKLLFQPGKSKQVIHDVSNAEHAIASFYGWQTHDKDHHKWGYNLATLSALLRNVGFVHIERLPHKEIALYVRAYKPDHVKNTHAKNIYLANGSRSLLRKAKYAWNRLVFKLSKELVIK
jgi:predicted SAM-dependent methyltransferase